MIVQLPAVRAWFSDDRRRRRFRRAACVAVAGCWLIWAALAWWTAPREVTAGQLDQDLVAGRVVTFTRADGWDDQGGFWGRRPEPRYDTHGWVMVWSMPDGRVRWADVGAPATESPIDGEDARLARVASAWRADGAPADRLADAAAQLAAAMALAWLVMLVAGPAPGAGSRWFWFWIGLLPFGVGLLAWLFREQWHARVPAGRDRQSGWAGLGWSLLGGLLLAAALAGLGSVFGDHVVPSW
ncbi:hypothetical protein ACNAW0_21340 [Micromonospora sp. SL1-18]|uniref:hypothetical protein n=1 Tax=Micromonospora sp. SL1-18 TaxID=3399128 RepID=UPI003A4D318D